NDESVVQSLMVPLHMIMGNEMSNGVPERIFTKENQLLETTFFDRPDKPFRIRIQIRRSRRQFDGLDAGICKDAKKLPRIQRISIVNEIALSHKETIHGIRLRLLKTSSATVSGSVRRRRSWIDPFNETTSPEILDAFASMSCVVSEPRQSSHAFRKSTVKSC